MENDKGHLGYKTSTAISEYFDLEKEYLNKPITANQSDIPSQLINWRKIRQMTLRKVEDITGISNAYLSMLETGRVKNPSFEVVTKLCICYKVRLIIN